MIAPPLFGEPVRADEILRQFGRHWAESTGLRFAEYAQREDANRPASIFAMAEPREAGKHRPVGTLYFSTAQAVEPMSPLQYTNIEAVCRAPKADDAMALIMDLYRLLRPSGELGGFGPFVHCPRLASMAFVVGIPVRMVDLWPQNLSGDAPDQLQWAGWRTSVVNIGSPPQLVGRTGHNPDGTAEARMVFQCMADGVIITAPPATIAITSTNDRSSVEVMALDSVGSDGLAEPANETLHLRWTDGDGERQSVVIAFEDLINDHTIGDLKNAVEANDGWSFAISDPDELGIADRPAHHLYSTDEITVTNTTAAALRVATPE
jgi:hypothetical protein